MGRAKARRLKFFAEHPFCCFCGGSIDATEEDHFPSRTLFRNRNWPEGYVFPACVCCNRATSRDELIVAWLSRARIQTERMTGTDEREFKNLMSSIRREFPGLLESMQNQLTHRERREAREAMNVSMPDGTSLLDLPILSVRDERFQDSVLSFGRKFGLALYYKHFGSPMPLAGGVGVRWYSNLQIEKGEIPETLATVLPDFPALTRAKVDLSDQFFYRVGIAEAEGRRMGAFMANFHTSFAIVGFISNERGVLEPTHFGAQQIARLYPPYTPSTPLP